MTPSEMIITVRQGTRQIDSYVRGSLQKEEILLHLNRAMDTFQYLKYKESLVNPLAVNDVRTTQKIQFLIIGVIGERIKNGIESEFPDDYRFLLDNYLGFSGYTKEIDFVNRSVLENYIVTPENIPIVRTPKGVIENNRITVVHDPFETPTKLYINYLRKPLRITESQPCEMPESTHERVCELAINYITGKTVPEEYQISTDLLSKTE